MSLESTLKECDGNVTSVSHCDFEIRADRYSISCVSPECASFVRMSHGVVGSLREGRSLNQLPNIILSCGCSQGPFGFRLWQPSFRYLAVDEAAVTQPA